jgi:hypothetical protein
MPGRVSLAAGAAVLARAARSSRALAGAEACASGVERQATPDAER